MGSNIFYTGELAIGTDSSYAEKKQKSVSSSNIVFGFDTYLDTARSREKDSRYIKTAQIKVNEDRHTKRHEAGQKRSGNESVENNTGRVDSKRSENYAKTNSENLNKVEKVADATGSEADSKLDENGAIKKVADLIGESDERVREILNTLNLNIFDLLNNENLMGFLMEALSVTDASELLGVSNIKDLYLQIHGVLEEMANQPANTDEVVSKLIDSSVDENAALTSNMETEAEASGLLSETDQYITGQEQTSGNQQAGATKHDGQDMTADSESAAEALVGKTSDEMLGTVVSYDESNVELNITTNGTDAREQRQGSQNTRYNGNDAEDMFNNQGSIQFNNNATAFREIQTKSQASLSSSGIDTQDIINQVVDKIKVDVRANVSEVRLTLRPESLGEVSLKIALENGILTAQFTAENQRVKALIESNFNQLKDALQQQGLDVAELYVSVGQDDAQGRMDMYDMSRRKNAERIRQIMGIVDDEEQDEPIIGDSVVDVMA